MYEKFTVYTDHAALHWLLNINDRSDRLIRWRHHFAGFDFEGKYKAGKANNQADALFRSNTMTKTIPRDDDDDIPTFLIESVNLDLKRNKSTADQDFEDVK